ncbi:MAG TPA: NAD-dependent epimerase/dehydratase family protein [Anaerolineales bacterium]|jgi:nucleoside-diphosphate-sugar epimerase|nr:NAD-dependent epimerase/dehydratase family protein [Anaerolineales bacterium]|tara:strand:+ start:1411 stop:2199 length:789 start_codon:yes stop_codon:yes gene_type:complete
MPDVDFVILGGTGFVGSELCSCLKHNGASVLAIDSRNYIRHRGTSADVLVNCNGNAFRFKANQNPTWDFEASVITVEQSLSDFVVQLYVYISTVDVYNILMDPEQNHEAYPIRPEKLDYYGFNKWIAERLVEKYAKRSLILRLGSVIGNGMQKGPLYDLLNAKPLHMSLDSELSFIDTSTIARVISVIVAMGLSGEIINLTGTGSAKLRDLSSMLPSSVQFGSGAHTVTHRYNINNTKIRGIMPIPTSLEVAKHYVGDQTIR